MIFLLKFGGIFTEEVWFDYKINYNNTFTKMYTHIYFTF